MKKNISGLTAVLLVAIFTAFTTTPNQTEYIFEYNGTSYTSEASVENKANWNFVSTNAGDLQCDDVNQKACRIKVTSPFVVAAGSGYILASGFTMNASFYNGPGSNDAYYITLTGDVSGVSNKLY